MKSKKGVLPLRESAKMEFYRYAVPCSDTFVIRGEMEKSERDYMISLISKGRNLPDGYESKFPVAMAMCTIIARGMGKDSIDREVVTHYFNAEHNVVAAKRYEERKDFDLDKCMVREGRVVETNKEFAMVETGESREECRTDFCKKIRIGDTVSVHHGFVVRKITPVIKKMIEKNRGKRYIIKN